VKRTDGAVCLNGHHAGEFGYQNGERASKEKEVQFKGKRAAPEKSQAQSRMDRGTGDGDRSTTKVLGGEKRFRGDTGTDQIGD